tara:strand:+ start:194 stop:2347 length:2154 start_codon:yes stop_codon:yes gene_type:complete
MSRARAAIISLVLASTLALVSPASIAEEGEIIIVEGHVDGHGPAWLEFECLQVSCTELELVVRVDGAEYVISDTHLVQWSGIVDSNLSWRVNVGEGFDIDDIVHDSILPDDTNLVEPGDLPETVPVPGNQAVDFEIDATSICQLDRCEINIQSEIQELAEGAIIVGSLENQEDKDSIRIPGGNGDVVVIEDFRAGGVADLEIWESGTSSKSLLGTYPSEGSFPMILDYPMNSTLWLRIVHPNDSGLTTYKIDVSRFDNSLEAPDGGELEGEWNHGEHLEFRSVTYTGHVSGFDSEGDSLLLQAGGKMDINPDCAFIGEVSVGIHLIAPSGEIAIQEQGATCPDEIATPADVFSIEFRITSNGPSSWTIGISSDSNNDGNMIGDAPDYLWSEGSPIGYYGPIIPGPGILSGTLGPEDNVDVHAIKIEDANGSRVYIRDEGSSPVNFQIQSLEQGSWIILNSTNGSMISLPVGTHALRIEKLASSDAEVEYRFTLIYAGEDIPDDAQLSDLSYLFRDLYLFLGALMVVPLVIVIWWERKRLFYGSRGSEIIEIHERRRLRRLRERLSKDASESEMNEQVVESALHQLGDSPWAGIISEWGDPVIRHMTEQIEVCAWGVDKGDSLILGIRVGAEDWKLAAIRFHSPEGAVAGISEVSPKRLFGGDEVFLDTLESESKTFIRVKIDGNPSVLSFQLSGLVGGEPVAATPRSAVDWKSLEEE